MKKEEKIEIMASTYDIASLIASVHSQADLTTQEDELIIHTVASWQAWMAEKLDLSSKDAIMKCLLKPQKKVLILKMQEKLKND